MTIHKTTTKRIPWNKGKKLPPLSSEHRLKIGSANRGKIRSLEARKKYSEVKKNNPPRSMLGKKHSEETKQKMRISAKGFCDLARKNARKSAKERCGDKNHRWKGGYENKLMHVKHRRVMKLNAEGSHTLSQWEELKMQYNYMCLCCKKSEPEITLSEDHIIPLTKGGSDDISNIQPLCRGCNSRKFTSIFDYRTLYKIPC